MEIEILKRASAYFARRPGSPATAGWATTTFGRLCLAYLEDVNITIVASDALEEGENPPLADD